MSSTFVWLFGWLAADGGGTLVRCVGCEDVGSLARESMNLFPLQEKEKI